MTKRSLIWLVDDTPLEAELARRTLEPTFEVRTFLDGNVALEELANGAVAPDLMVLDWHMPGINGIEICQFLRASAATLALPILMLTSNDRTEDVVMALTAGADDYVRKPHQPAELMARAGALLRSNALLLRARSAEAAIRSLLSQLPDGVLVVEPLGRVVFANAEAERVFAGQSKGALVGKPVGALLPSLASALLALRDANDPPALPDVSVGDQIYAPIVGRVRLDDAMMATITLRNVTVKHREESRRLDFYSIIAHDLRSPLHAMSLRTSLLLEGARGPLSAEVRGELEKVADRIRSLAAIINDFLDLARLEAKSIIIEAEDVTLRAILDDVVDTMAPLAETKNIKVRIIEEDGISKVSVDKRRVGQVMSNLLSNAIKFSSKGSEVVIRIGLVPLGTEVTFQDSGPGIADAELPLLFQRYARVSGTNVAGTGLGLMIVREVVEAHGGTVHVTSEVGHGSRFGFVLPHTLDAPPTAPAHA